MYGSGQLWTMEFPALPGVEGEMPEMGCYWMSRDGPGNGDGEIRTHEGVPPSAVFKTAAFNRSATSPRAARCRRAAASSHESCRAPASSGCGALAVLRFPRSSPSARPGSVAARPDGSGGPHPAAGSPRGATRRSSRCRRLAVEQVEDVERDPHVALELVAQAQVGERGRLRAPRVVLDQRPRPEVAKLELAEPRPEVGDRQRRATRPSRSRRGWVAGRDRRR